ncbi:MAG: hypothetical protein AUK63_680 [bacterium P3]|nr:MAG: hypothetical protein AUK63_680 [bacterium P3]KWW42163.1 MAG: hypothetical protein F083_502 [bacterium F083]
MKYTFILNGRSDRQHDADHIRQMLTVYASTHADNFQYDTYLTQGEGDATRYVHIYCDLHPAEQVCFVACGGDGMINEVVSGMAGFDHKTLAILAIGSLANDFIKNFPESDFQSIEALVEGQNRQIDILRVNDNYSINVCNFGFDSVVARVANNIISHGGRNAYRWGIVAGIFAGRYNRISVKVDGHRMPGRRMLLCTLANGRYVGGEFLCAPYARIDDGLIEVCHCRTMSLLRLLLSMDDYRHGLHLKRKRHQSKFIYRQARHVEVTSKETIYLCLDGELLPGSRFNIDILPSAITFREPGHPQHSVNRSTGAKVS